jgi:hypothetical protein
VWALLCMMRCERRDYNRQSTRSADLGCAARGSSRREGDVVACSASNLRQLPRGPGEWTVACAEVPRRTASAQQVGAAGGCSQQRVGDSLGHVPHADAAHGSGIGGCIACTCVSRIPHAMQLHLV